MAAFSKVHHFFGTPCIIHRVSQKSIYIYIYYIYICIISFLMATARVPWISSSSPLWCTIFIAILNQFCNLQIYFEHDLERSRIYNGRSNIPRKRRRHCPTHNLTLGVLSLARPSKLSKSDVSIMSYFSSRISSKQINA